MYGHRATLYGALRAVPARRGRACLEADPRNVAAARTPRARETGLKLNGECVLSECVLDTDSSVCSWCRLSSVSCVQVSVGYCLLGNFASFVFRVSLSVCGTPPDYGELQPLPFTCVCAENCRCRTVWHGPGRAMKLVECTDSVSKSKCTQTKEHPFTALPSHSQGWHLEPAL